MEENQNIESSQTPPLGGWGAAAIFSKSECIGHYSWGDDCHGWNFIDTDALSVKQELMPPDTAEVLHYHERATQLFFILKGRASFTIDGVNFDLREQQGITVYPGQKHFIANQHNTDLEFILYSYPSTKNDRVNAAP